MTLDLHYRQSKINWKEVGLLLLTIVMFTITIFYRRADAFTNPQFWAEDGIVFFMDQDNSSTFLGFKNYNGYIHFLPRTIAFLPHVFSIPYEHIPTLYNYSAYIITIFYLLLAWILLPFKAVTKFLMISSAGIVPISAEIYMNLTNIQWFSCIGLVLLIFPLRIQSLGRSIILSIAVCMAGLTGPFSVILLPLIIVNIVRYRKSALHLFPLIIALITAVIQFIFLLNHFQERVHPDVQIPANHFLLSIYNSVKLVIFPNSIPANIFKLYHCIPALFLIMAILFVVRNGILKKRFDHLMIIAAIILFVLFTVFANWPYEWLLTPFGMGARYFFVPFLLIAWYFFIQLEKQQILRLVPFGLMLTIFSLNFNKVKMRLFDFQWKKEVKEYYETGDQVAFTNPVGWYVIFKKKN